jgi:IPT/TIG domain
MEFSGHLRATALIAVLLASAMTAALPSAASARFARSAYHVQRAGCGKPHLRRGAACQALRLVPSSSPASSSGASPSVKQRGARGVRQGKNKEPAAGALTPQDLHGAYDLPSETSVSGTQTIAVVDAYKDPTVESDLAVYDQEFGLPECTNANGCLRVVNQKGDESPLPANEGGWAIEITIDVQMAHAICQSCHILLVEAENEEDSSLAAGVNAALGAGATVISNSYASYGAEAEGAAEERELNEQSYDHPDTVITASSGDCGYRDQATIEPSTQCEGLPSAVGFPAVSPDVVAVGGTELSDSAGSWVSDVWGDGGGGCSSIFDAPTWQTGVSNWSDTHCGSFRLSADVSAEADPYTGVAVYDSTVEKGSRESGWLVYGGTSVASPIVAAEFALSGGARSVSYPAKTLYGHIGQAAALYDVTSGANGTCGGATSCEAAVGSDGPSGVGSPLGLAAFAPTAGTPASTSAPGVTGIAEVGETLKLTSGSWSNSPSSTQYQWEDCDSAGSACVAIEGATGTSYEVGSGDSGSRIRVMETAGNASGFGSPAFSAETATVGAGAPAPTITGISPKKGTAGTTVAIRGTGFAKLKSVDFGATASKSYEILSEHEILAEAPEGSGTVLVTVTTASGTSQVKHKGKAEFKYKKPRR